MYHNMYHFLYYEKVMVNKLIYKEFLKIKASRYNIVYLVLRNNLHVLKIMTHPLTSNNGENHDY